MCIRRETREKARRSLAFSRVSKPHTHITHISTVHKYCIFTNMYPWTCYQCNNTFKRTINDEEISRVLEFCLYFTSIPCLINKLILVLNTWKDRFGPTPLFWTNPFSVFWTNMACTLCIRVWTCFQFNYAFNKGFKAHLDPHSPLFGPIFLFLYSAVTFHVHYVCMNAGAGPGGGGGAHLARTPWNWKKIRFFGVRSWFFTRNTPTIFAPPSARWNFF